MNSLSARSASRTTPTARTATYDYDGLGRRFRKVVTGDVGAGETRYLSDGAEEVAEYDGSNTLLRRYVTGPGIDDRIAMWDSNGFTAYLTNHQNSPIGLYADAASNTLTAKAYGEYGETSCTSAGGQPYTYTGRRCDPETGLMYYRARYYSPALGRFLQTDPIGTKADLNLYTYVYSDPGNQTDPSGNCPPNICRAVFGAVVGAVVGAATNVAAQMVTNEPGQGIDSSRVIASAVVGAIAGGTGGAIIVAEGSAIAKTVASMGLGGLSAGIGQEVDNVVTGNPAEQGAGSAAVAGMLIVGGGRVATAVVRNAMTPLPNVNNASPTPSAVTQSIASAAGTLTKAFIKVGHSAASYFEDKNGEEQQPEPVNNVPHCSGAESFACEP